MNTEAILWLVLALIFLLVEANTVAVVSAWFCIGALAAMAASFMGAKLWLEVTVFVVVSALMLAAFRPLVKKHLNGKVQKTNIDAVIGSVGTVLEPIDNIAATGRVKLGGMEWSARSTSGATIAPGTVIKVDRIEGVKVFVSFAEEQIKEEIV